MPMTRRSFLSTLTACLAALGLRRKAEAPITLTYEWRGIKGLVDDGTPLVTVAQNICFYDGRSGKRTPMVGGPPVTLHNAVTWTHVPAGSRIARGGFLKP